MARLSTLILAFVAAAGLAKAQYITCYGYSGTYRYDNNTRCPGSNVCCGPEATCLSNRLCHNPDDDDDVFVRGSCATKDYDSGTCAQICLFDEDGDNGRLPRVTTCKDGSLCCVRDTTCCEDGNGIFLDNDGKIADKAPSTTYSWGPERTESGFRTATDEETSSASKTDEATSTSSSDSKETSSEGGDSDSSENGSSSSNSGDDDMGLKIGLGVGIPVAAIVVGAVAFWFIWRKRKQSKATAELSAENDMAKYGGPQYGPGGHGFANGHSNMPPAELAGSSYGSDNRQISELGDSSRPGEMVG